MKNLTRGILLVVISIAVVIGPALQAADSYAAIVFCTSSGSWGSASGAATKAEAIANAIEKCNCPDADVRTNWCRNAWIALAVSNQSKGGWGSAWGETPEIAKSKAMAECLARNPDAHVVLYVSSQ
jgi:hypothetical protein